MPPVDSDAALTRLIRDAGLALDPSPGAWQRLRALFELRARWGRTHNLTGPRAHHDPWATDVVDALALLAALDPALPLVDVGAGGGAPGLVLAALRPEQAVVLVEPSPKRVAFLRTAVHDLGLTTVRVWRVRWPAPLDQPLQIASRAVVDPAAWPAFAVSAGRQVQVFFRMLAARRPEVVVPGFDCELGVDYTAPGESLRRIERWRRRG